MTLTPAQVKAYGIGTVLSDDSLQALLNAAYASIDQRIAPSGPMRERMTVSGPMLLLSRSTLQIVTVVENGVTLSTNDYEVRGSMLLRLSTGTHPQSRWRGTVDVSYMPTDADDQVRDAVALQLVQLDLNVQHGLASRTIGNYSETFESGSGDYMQQREAILSSLREPAYLL